MTKKALILVFVLALGLSGCARLGQTNNPSGGTVVGSAPSQTFASTTNNNATEAASSATDISAFVDSGVVAKLSQKERVEAASAQYYALQFGRPGAPRSWQGDNGSSGKVSVGPYVRVNTLDCRDFSHIVTIAGSASESKGTACREPDGKWTVVDN